MHTQVRRETDCSSGYTGSGGEGGLQGALYVGKRKEEEEERFCVDVFLFKTKGDFFFF